MKDPCLPVSVLVHGKKLSVHRRKEQNRTKHAKCNPVSPFNSRASSSTTTVSNEHSCGVAMQDLRAAAMNCIKNSNATRNILHQNHITGNMVGSALALATQNSESGKERTLPAISNYGPSTKALKPRKKTSINTKCPIVISLKKTLEKQNERERYWKRKGMELPQKENLKLPTLSQNALFQHRKQKYEDFEAQERGKKARIKCLKRLIMPRMSMY